MTDCLWRTEIKFCTFLSLFSVTTSTRTRVDKTSLLTQNRLPTKKKKKTSLKGIGYICTLLCLRWLSKLSQNSFSEQTEWLAEKPLQYNQQTVWEYGDLHLKTLRLYRPESPLVWKDSYVWHQSTIVLGLHCLKKWRIIYRAKAIDRNRIRQIIWAEIIFIHESKPTP